MRDRTTAANILGEALKNIIEKEDERKNSIVLAIARGGVIADTIARKLSCRIRHSYARKLCAPQNEEVAIGAIMGDVTTYLNEVVLKNWGYLQNILKKKKHCNGRDKG